MGQVSVGSLDRTGQEAAGNGIRRRRGISTDSTSVRGRTGFFRHTLIRNGRRQNSRNAIKSGGQLSEPAKGAGRSGPLRGNRRIAHRRPDTMNRSGNDGKTGDNDFGPEKPRSLAPPRSARAGGGADVTAFQDEDPATTVFTLPRFELSALMPETSGRLLDTLKNQISQLTIEQAGSGIRHEDGQYVVLPKTLRSAWMARVNHLVLGETRFLIGQTRSIWVLLYDKPHERIYDDPRFMGVELKRTDVARTPKGKQMFVSRIEKEDLVKINAIAAQDAGERVRTDTLAPTEGAFSHDDTLGRLHQCTVDQSTDDDFEPASFFASIRFITPTQGSTGNYYYLEAGEPEAPKNCQLHVGTDPQLPEEAYAHKATLSYGDERIFLYIGVE